MSIGVRVRVSTYMCACQEWGWRGNYGFPPGGDRTYDLGVGASGLNHCATPAHTLPSTPPSSHTHTHTHTHTRTHAHTHFYSSAHTQATLYTSPSHARKAPLGATHTEKFMVCGVEGDARPNPLCMCVCEACAGQLPLHTLAIFMFEPEIEGEGGKTGGRRPYHRLPRQKLCLMVSSDPKLVSGTQVAVFDRAGFRTRDAPMPSPATLTPSPARRRLIGRGDWLRVLGAGPGTLLRSPGPPPYLRRWGAGDRARALPFVVVVTRGAPAPGPTGRYRARPGHVGHVPAPFFVVRLL